MAKKTIGNKFWNNFYHSSNNQEKRHKTISKEKAI